MSLALANDDRFRGRSISDGHPIATASLSYEDKAGIYLGAASTIAWTRHDGIEPLRRIVYGGYVRQVSSGISVDVGATRRTFSRHATIDYARRFNEFHIGLVTPRLTIRTYFSPNYDGLHGSTTYGELNALLWAKETWSLSGHFGLLSPPRSGERAQPHPEGDWRLTATRRFDRLGLSVSWVGATPDHDRHRWRGGLVVSLERSF